MFVRISVFKMHQEQKRIYMAMSPEQKLQVALSLYYSAHDLKEAAIKMRHPDWNKEQIKNEVKKIFLNARA